MKRDLAKLYSELGLQPDCSLEEFNRTYRRRIAQLHPDKARPDPAGEMHALPELIWLYATATRFHRRYGRLPGAAPARAQDPARLRQSTIARPASVTASDPPPTAQIPVRPGNFDALPRRGRLMALLLLALLLILALSWT